VEDGDGGWGCRKKTSGMGKREEKTREESGRLWMKSYNSLLQLCKLDSTKFKAIKFYCDHSSGAYDSPIDQ